MRDVLRTRVMDAAVELICNEGWSGVTVERLAARLGVRPEIVRDEFGTKDELGAAVVVRETDRFVLGISRRLHEHADAGAAVAAAVSYTLTTGAENRLVRAIVAGSDGPDADLSPLAATEFENVVRRVVEAIVHVVRQQRFADLGGLDVERAVERLVRMTLGHLVQRTMPIETAMAEIRAAVSDLLPA